MDQPHLSDAELAQLSQQVVQGILHRVTAAALAVMHDEGLTLPQLVTLRELARSRTLSIGGVGSLLDLSTSAASHLVERLVERGLVERQESLDDRRQKMVQLAPAGQELVDRLVRPHQEELVQLLSSMDVPTRNVLTQFFEKVS